ncbi:MAG: hypothetical protein NVS4B2_23810 [Chloroflexota bacterium]
MRPRVVNKETFPAISGRFSWAARCAPRCAPGTRQTHYAVIIAATEKCVVRAGMIFALEVFWLAGAETVAAGAAQEER